MSMQIYIPDRSKIKSCCHLGDIINIVQYSINQKFELYAPKKCQCCGNLVLETIKTIKKLIDAKLIVKENKNEMDYPELYPLWLQGKDQIIYQQSKNIISQKNDNILVCSFTGRTGKGSYRRKYLKKIEIIQVLKLYNDKKIINIGDETIDFFPVENKCNLSLEGKYNLINEASQCITIDNGIAHLCAMTGTNTIVYYPKWRDPSFLMPKNKNLRIEPVDLKLY